MERGCHAWQLTLECPRAHARKCTRVFSGRSVTNSILYPRFGILRGRSGRSCGHDLLAYGGALWRRKRRRRATPDQAGAARRAARRRRPGRPVAAACRSSCSLRSRSPSASSWFSCSWSSGSVRSPSPRGFSSFSMLQSITSTRSRPPLKSRASRSSRGRSSALFPSSGSWPTQCSAGGWRRPPPKKLPRARRQ